jgi:hypothetical protein
MVLSKSPRFRPHFQSYYGRRSGQIRKTPASRGTRPFYFWILAQRLKGEMCRFDYLVLRKRMVSDKWQQGFYVYLLRYRHICYFPMRMLNIDQFENVLDYPMALWRSG